MGSFQNITKVNISKVKCVLIPQKLEFRFKDDFHSRVDANAVGSQFSCKQ